MDRSRSHSAYAADESALEAEAVGVHLTRDLANFIIPPPLLPFSELTVCFGRFIDFLDKRLYDNNIVIFTSDHGDSLSEANRWGHSSTILS